MIDTIYTLIGVYLDVFILYIYLEKCKTKISKYQIVLLFSLYGVINTILDIFEVLYAAKLVLCIPLCVCVILLAFHGISWFDALKYAIIFFTLLKVGELLVIPITVLSEGIYDIDFVCVEMHLSIRFFRKMISRVITIILIKSIGRYWHTNHIKKNKIEQILLHFPLLFAFTISVIVEHYFNDIEKLDRRDAMSILIMVSILLFVYILTSMRLLEINIIMQQQEKQIFDFQHMHEMQYWFYEEKSKYENELRRIRHDLKNHLLLIKNMREVGNINYYQRLLDLVSNENVIISGCIVFDILINEKKKIAEQQKIFFEVIITKNISCINYIQEWDLCLIFGNLIDNAMENAVKVECPKITVNLDIINKFFIMIISNTYDSNKIRKVRGVFLTTKENTDKHGMGLKSVEAAIDKYDGYLEIEYDQSLFRVKVLIPINNNAKKAI